MHRMNANRPPINGVTNSLSDESLLNIKNGVDKIQQRRLSKRNASISKIASVNTEAKIVDPKPTIKISNLNEIPPNFERIGTGFYRNGHHLWELSPHNDGFMLVRKHGEDHVLGYDPEPISKNETFDRKGNTIKIGSKVIVPHHGKLAEGTVLLIEPQSLGLELESGENINASPDMVDVIKEMMDKLFGGGEESDKGLDKFIQEEEAEGEHSPEAIKELKNREKEEQKEEGHSNKKSKDAFEPKVERSSKESYRRIVAQTSVSEESSSEPTSRPNEIKRIANLIDPDTQSWKDYWYSVGRRVALATPKPPAFPIGGKPPKIPAPKTPKIPKAETPEGKAQRQKRRKERKQMTQGLPPGAYLPPRKPIRVPKAQLEKIADEATDKDIIRICKQLVDELRHVLDDEDVRNQPELLADNVEQALDHYDEEIESTDEENEEELEDELSIETPPKDKRSLDDLRSATKISISMSDLR